MSTPILATKLYIPPPRPAIVRRPHLGKRLNDGLRHNQVFGRKLTLISAAAGFGKTTLVSEWVSGSGLPVGWLSLDDGDSDPARFLMYLVAALQTIAPEVGKGVLAALQSPQPPAPEAILTSLLNDLAAIPHPFFMVLDDYHALDAPPVDQALTFLLEYLPPQMHLVIATREDPPLPLARLRARSQLAELRAADLRFTAAEAATFLNQVMGLNLTAVEIDALEARTEGWIAGLHLAALALQGPVYGRGDAAAFIQDFSGSHHFVLDYLVEEVLQQQPERIQTFLLHTAVLNRLCTPLCDVLVPDNAGQETLAYLERANLFIVPLDNERRWYRYHHLFAELLRQRLHQQQPDVVADLHIRASIWYEANDLELEAFHHATAAQDVDRAERLLEGRGMPLLFRGAVRPVLHWLGSLPTAVLDAHPSLWVMYAAALLFITQTAGVEEKLQAAETALQGRALDEKTCDLIGHIATIRATVAVVRQDVETIMAQSHRALENLHPRNLPVRTAANWALGYAYHLQGDRAAAGQGYSEAIAISQSIGHYIVHLMATIGLGNIQEMQNHLLLAVETYRRALELAGDPPLPVACEAHLGLARIAYEWNDLATAEEHGRQSWQLTQQLENTDRLAATDLFLARLKLAQGDVSGAAALWAQTEQAVRHHHFTLLLPEVTAVHILILLHQNQVTAAAKVAQTADLPLCQARVYLAQGDTAAALAVLQPWRQQAEARGWANERLRAMVLQVVVYGQMGEGDTAVSLLADALALAEPGGFVRLFVDEGLPMVQLLADAASRSIATAYTARLLSAFSTSPAITIPQPALIEPLSERELEVLRLVAQGFSNREIGERLFLALDTVKGHNRRIYDKLGVQRRTEAVARARERGLL
ncbi:MAG: LuxR family transcriptional regulator [Anaerolineae bacterium]|nr:LuxR family transcriptional regulator [Anaerolineae bacterium]